MTKNPLVQGVGASGGVFHGESCTPLHTLALSRSFAVALAFWALSFRRNVGVRFPGPVKSPCRRWLQLSSAPTWREHHPPGALLCAHAQQLSSLLFPGVGGTCLGHCWGASPLCGKSYPCFPCDSYRGFPFTSFSKFSTESVLRVRSSQIRSHSGGRGA